VNLIDVPGLNDRSKEASETFKTIATWLYVMQKHHKGAAWLNGMIYLHDITKARIEASDVECLMLLQKICGDAACSNTLIVLNKCDKVTHSRVHPFMRNADFEDFEKKKEGFVKAFPAYKDHVIIKHDQSPKTARGCLDNMMDAQPFQVQLLTELEHKSHSVLAKTSAGKYLISTKLEPSIQKLKLDIKRTDDAVEREKLRAQLKALEKERNEMSYINKKTLTDAAAAVNGTAFTMWSVGGSLLIIPHVGLTILIVAAVTQAIGLGLGLGAAFMNHT